MPEKEKIKNIVQRVFDRKANESQKVSPLFTYFKHASKVLPSKELQLQTVFTPLPAAIDLGHASVKLLQMAKNSRGELEIIAIDEEPYGAPSERQFFSLQKEALQKILNRNKIGLNVVIALAAKEIQSYNFVFPPMSETELSDAVQWKLRQSKPFDTDLEKVKYGFLKWENFSLATSGIAQQRVTAICASTEMISKKLALLQEVGLKPAAIEVGPVSMTYLKRIRKKQTRQDEVVIWLDLGAEASTCVIEKDGSVYFVRGLSLTGKQLTDQIARRCNVSEKEAEDLKKRHGLEAWSAGKRIEELLESKSSLEFEALSTAVFHSLVSSLENLVIDIEHTFKYFSYQVCQSQITRYDRVILSGGVSNLKNLELYLAEKLQVSVEKINPFAGYRIEPGLESQKQAFLNHPPSFAVAAGLALAPMIEKSHRINLSYGEEKNPLDLFIVYLKKNPIKVASLVAMLLLLLVGPEISTAYYYDSKAATAERKVKTSRSELSGLQKNQLTLAEDETKYLDRKKLLESKLELLEKSSKGKRDFSKVLATLSAILPEEIWVTKLSYLENKMTLIGLTLKNEFVVSLIEELKKSEDFSAVTFNYTQKETNSAIYRFEVTMNVR